ncbi:MAG: sigma-70 family RNA polymerase sigma factor [Ktedonobacteraceae bacterium]|nr:sigma-70 family RNA polymerase sigma factor [Ktedonobacteraceae bacterium]
MDVTSNLTTACSDPINDAAWQDLHIKLRAFALRQVYAYALPSWRGQEEDIAADIVQETTRRVVERMRKAERGEAAPVQAPTHMMFVIAANYCHDLWRRERRIVRLSTCNCASGEEVIQDDRLNFSEEATENAYREELFSRLAHEIARFPKKQRQALLVDLANRMHFGSRPTPLQDAFLHAGIQLQEYQLPPSANATERGKLISLQNHAYRRIAKLPCVQDYVSAP